MNANEEDSKTGVLLSKESALSELADMEGICQSSDQTRPETL